MATGQCARKGKMVRPLQERAAIPPYILGNFPRVEWLFECTEMPVSKASGAQAVDKVGQIERLKKLLDSGALTQQEFESEKAKILGSQ